MCCAFPHLLLVVGLRAAASEKVTGAASVDKVNY